MTDGLTITREVVTRAKAGADLRKWWLTYFQKGGEA